MGASSNYLPHPVTRYVMLGGQPADHRLITMQAWIEASTKGAVLIFTSAEIDKYATKTFDVSPATAGLLGGVGGGVAQAYATMGVLNAWLAVATG